MKQDKSSKNIYKSHIQNVARFVEELEKITQETNQLALESNIFSAEELSQKVSQDKIDVLKARYEIIQSLLKESLDDLRTYVAFNSDEKGPNELTAKKAVPHMPIRSAGLNIFEFKPNLER